MKKLLALVPGFLSLAAVAAEGDGGYSGSVAETIATQAQTQLQGYLTGIGPIVATIVVGGLAIWAGIAIVGILKRAFSAGKGR